jgi:hypothetical protein
MLHQENVQFRRKHSGGAFLLHMDSSRCHNRKKITTEIRHRRFARAWYPLDSPDLNPCDFWLFGLMKHSLKDREIRAIQVLIRSLANI